MSLSSRFGRPASGSTSTSQTSGNASSTSSGRRTEDTQRTERPGLSREELEELEEAFKLFDTQNTGKYCQPSFFNKIGLLCGSHTDISLLPLTNTLFGLFVPYYLGLIDAAELKSAMESLGYKHKNKMVYNMIESLPSGMLSFDQFLNLMTARVSDTDSREDIAKVTSIHPPIIFPLLIIVTPCPVLFLFSPLLV